jgi:hypothetical protein
MQRSLKTRKLKSRSEQRSINQEAGDIAEVYEALSSIKHSPIGKRGLAQNSKSSNNLSSNRGGTALNGHTQEL